MAPVGTAADGAADSRANGQGLANRQTDQENALDLQERPNRMVHRSSLEPILDRKEDAHLA